MILVYVSGLLLASRELEHLFLLDASLLKKSPVASFSDINKIEKNMWCVDEGGKTTDPDCLVPFSGSTCQTQQISFTTSITE